MSGYINISKGYKQSREQETKTQAEGRKENVTEINLQDKKKMTTEEMEQHITTLSKAVLDLTERLDKQNGGTE